MSGAARAGRSTPGAQPPPLPRSLVGGVAGDRGLEASQFWARRQPRYAGGGGASAGLRLVLWLTQAQFEQAVPVATVSLTLALVVRRPRGGARVGCDA